MEINPCISLTQSLLTIINYYNTGSKNLNHLSLLKGNITAVFNLLYLPNYGLFFLLSLEKLFLLTIHFVAFIYIESNNFYLICSCDKFSEQSPIISFLVQIFQWNLIKTKFLFLVVCCVSYLAVLKSTRLKKSGRSIDQIYTSV